VLLTASAGGTRNLSMILVLLQENQLLLLLYQFSKEFFAAKTFVASRCVDIYFLSQIIRHFVYSISLGRLF